MGQQQAEIGADWQELSHDQDYLHDPAQLYQDHSDQAGTYTGEPRKLFGFVWLTGINSATLREPDLEDLM
jgi:hypothetical protein